MQFEYNENIRGAKMIDTGKEQSVNLIKDFIKDVLNSDIDKLKDFSFLNLNTDIKYHQDEYKNIKPEHIEKYGGYFIKKGCKPTLHQCVNDYDDMNLIRAINSLLYIYEQNKIPNLAWDDMNWEYENSKPEYENYNYRGETINTFQTLIDEKSYKDFFKDIESSGYLINKIEKFLYKLFTIGNFMLLPNKKFNLVSLNTYKGDYNGMRDYSDTFFKCILNIENNETINKLKETNSFWYNFKDKNNIKKFIEDNYLQDYFNDNCELNYSFSHHDRHGDYDKTKDINEKYIYALHICEYIDTVTELINKRADRMIIDLKKIINKES